MGIVVNDQPTGPRKEFPLPSEGMALVVLADVQDLGIQENEKYGPRREVALSWVVNEQDEEGNYFVIRRRFTASLNEKSNLYATIKDMVGKNPPPELDLEVLIGRVNQATIKITTGTKGKNAGKKFANITTFFLPKPGTKFAVPADFVREKDGGSYGKLNKKTSNAKPAVAAPAPAADAEEDMPF